MELQIQGNIAVKALPIRLLALCTIEGSHAPPVRTLDQGMFGKSCCIAQSGPINCFTAGQHWRLATSPRSGDNCCSLGSLGGPPNGRRLAATVSQDIQ